MITKVARASSVDRGIVVSLLHSQPSGLDLSADGSRLYVALNTLHRLAIIDTATRSVIAQVPVGIHPYTAVLSADGSKVYVSNWGGKVPGPGDFTDGVFPVVVDTRTGIPVVDSILFEADLPNCKSTRCRRVPAALSSAGMRYLSRSNNEFSNAVCAWRSFPGAAKEC